MFDIPIQKCLLNVQMQTVNRYAMSLSYFIKQLSEFVKQCLLLFDKLKSKGLNQAMFCFCKK